MIVPNYKSKIFIIPNFICDLSSDYINSSYYDFHFLNIKILFVENFKSARRLLKKIDKKIDINAYIWVLLESGEEKNHFINAVKNGMDMGIISDSGYPCIADPGSHILSWAHEYDLDIVPLVGPSSILLALVCSGMNGQNFTFHGYLPINENEKISRIKEIENSSKRNGYTQIFIETPYRNHRLFNTILTVCNNSTILCIALNIGSEKQVIKTKTIVKWRNLAFNMEKEPAIFLLKAEFG